MNDIIVSEREIQILYEQIQKDAETSGYHLNTDDNFVKDLIKGLLINLKRYGYQSCPCRIANGIKEEDTDIICPCDYRDDDLTEFGCCYCALYISSEDIIKRNKKVISIPERRPAPEQRKITKDMKRADKISSLPLPVWRCKVCGYLCARENSPEICPICKAKKERFERFI
jgi:ferredoxin-thioredoxin reductase catalytic subunit/rubredoxin